ncbi:MAG: Fe-S cluster assembly protein SufD [Candidatus Omnitrophica bacterium]|nr:Fe-S cluster assembly protein SufD [Candidatus Omnitrophota bacterium]
MIRNIEHITKSLIDERMPQWFNTLRIQGLSRFIETGIPAVSDPNWKYTDLEALKKLAFDVSENGELNEWELLNQFRNHKDINIVLLNGAFSVKHSDLDNLEKGVLVSTLHEAVKNNAPHIQERLTKYPMTDTAAFIALNQALNGPGVYILVDEKVVSNRLIHIIHVTHPGRQNFASMPRTLIVMEPFSEAAIFESHVAFGDSRTYFSNALTDIFMNENATLHYCKSQKESLKAFHIGHTRVWQERDSSFDGFSFMAGGRLTRNNVDAVLNGEGANARLNAFYSVNNSQHVDNHTSIEHRVPNCASNQLYKGILNDSARAVFNGRILVRPEAQKTNSYQLNKNLLLGSGCRVDTKPQLEIFADDVKCTHGATIGQLDEDEMFYLQTRGIGKNAASRMLAEGFLSDLLNTVKNAAVREKLNSLTRRSFEAS